MATKALPVSFRLQPEVKAAAEKAAEDDRRSLSSFIEKLLVDHLRAQGYLPKQPKQTAKRHTSD
jgi:hypothetical protein